MKILTLIFLLFSFNSLAKVTYKCGKEKWNHSTFKGKIYHVEIQRNCTSSIDPADLEKMEGVFTLRFQKAPDVIKVHEVGNEDYKGMSGRYVVSNIKQVVKDRGDMNIKYHSFIGSDNQNRVRVHNRSLNIKATGYSRYTKKINKWIMVSVVNNKVNFVFREYDEIEKPRIAPRGIFEPAAKDGLAKNNLKNIGILFKYINKNL